MDHLLDGFTAQLPIITTYHLKQLFHWPKVNAYTRVKGGEELAGKGMLTLKTANQWCHLHTSYKATKI